VNEPLQKLATLFGIRGDLHVYETAGEWKYYGDADTSHISGDKGLAAFSELLDELKTHYGDALSLSLKSGSWTEFETNAAAPDNALDDLRAAIDSGSTLTLDVKIDKAALAPHWQLTDPAVTTRLFFFAPALVRELSVPLQQLDTELFRNVPAGQKVVILLTSHDIYADGERLAIIGGNAMSQWRNAIAPSAEPPLLAIAHVRTNWVQFDLNRLTPLHLLVNVKQANDGDPIIAALHAQLFLCSMIYLAHRTMWDGAAWTCTFAADRQETDVRMQALTTPNATEWASVQTLAELVRWGYVTDRIDDRLIVLQRTFVEALQDNSADTNAAEVLRLAAELAKRVRWGWEAFVAGELKKYVEQMKALEETVAATAKDYNEQVGTLATTVITNMLGAVGVILGSFLAAIFKLPFEDYAFRFGMIIYVIYLLVFPMAMGLTATWQRFVKSRETFRARKESFAKRLREEPVTAITRSILGRSENWFLRWYVVSLALYVAVIGVLIAAIVVVPSEIKSWNDQFVLKSAWRNQPVTGTVTIRGERFDKDKDIVVTLGPATFTNATDPQTLKVHGSTALTFTPQKNDLVAPIVTVRQGAAVPRSIKLN